MPLSITVKQLYSFKVNDAKNTQKYNIFGLMGTSLGVYRLMPFILESCRPAAVILIDM